MNNLHKETWRKTHTPHSWFFFCHSWDSDGQMGLLCSCWTSMVIGWALEGLSWMPAFWLDSSIPYSNLCSNSDPWSLEAEAEKHKQIPHLCSRAEDKMIQSMSFCRTCLLFGCPVVFFVFNLQNQFIILYLLLLRENYTGSISHTVYLFWVKLDIIYSKTNKYCLMDLSWHELTSCIFY